MRTFVQLAPGGKLHIVAGGRTVCGTRPQRKGAQVITQQQFDRGNCAQYLCERCR